MISSNNHLFCINFWSQNISCFNFRGYPHAMSRASICHLKKRQPFCPPWARPLVTHHHHHHGTPQWNWYSWSLLCTIPLSHFKTMSTMLCVKGLKYNSGSPRYTAKLWGISGLLTVVKKIKGDGNCLFHIHGNQGEYIPGWYKDDIIHDRWYRCGAHGSSSSVRHQYMHLPQIREGM